MKNAIYRLDSFFGTFLVVFALWCLIRFVCINSEKKNQHHTPHFITSTFFLHLINKLNFENFHEHVMMKMKVFAINVVVVASSYSLSFESGFLAERLYCGAVIV